MAICEGCTEASSMKALMDWRKIFNETSDPVEKEQAAGYIRHYERDLIWYERRRSREANRQRAIESVKAMPVALPPLTIYEVLCTPLWIAEVLFRYAFLGGMWTAINVVILGLLIGGAWLR